MYRIDGDNKYTPVLYLDTLKVSTIEETASSVDATGGKGNAKLISWDYGKEITVTLEDALFSMESLALMHGALTTPGQGVKGSVTGLMDDTKTDQYYTMTSRCKGTADGKTDLSTRVSSLNLPSDATIEYYGPQGEKITDDSFKENEWYIAQWKVKHNDTGAQTIEISANSFPGTYRLEGTTYIREQTTGQDKFWKFEIPMAKMDPAQTITMQADGKQRGYCCPKILLIAGKPCDGQSAA